MATGLRETGWAVFDGGAFMDSGLVGLKSTERLEPSVRIAHQLDSFDSIAQCWRIGSVARVRTGRVNLRPPGLEQLDEGLRRWACGLGMPVAEYTSREVRAAVAGQPSASRDAQCYAIMQRLGLIGQSRATAEWEAMAVGYHHQALRKDG